MNVALLNLHEEYFFTLKDAPGVPPSKNAKAKITETENLQVTRVDGEVIKVGLYGRVGRVGDVGVNDPVAFRVTYHVSPGRGQRPMAELPTWVTEVLDEHLAVVRSDGADFHERETHSHGADGGDQDSGG